MRESDRSVRCRRVFRLPTLRYTPRTAPNTLEPCVVWFLTSEPIALRVEIAVFVTCKVHFSAALLICPIIPIIIASIVGTLTCGASEQTFFKWPEPKQPCDHNVDSNPANNLHISLPLAGNLSLCGARSSRMARPSNDFTDGPCRTLQYPSRLFRLFGRKTAPLDSH